MAEPTYIFVDESGDPGDNDGTRQNSLYYTELAMQIDADAPKRIASHVINWRYVKGIMGEPKRLALKIAELKRFLAPFVSLYEDGSLKCSAVFLRKPTYNGPYLKGSGKYGSDEIKFRNFIHKQLLEHHLRLYPKNPSHYLQVVFDSYPMNRPQIKNVTDYLCNVCGLPIDNISHFDSSCSWMLQTSGQLANLVSQVPLGGANEDIAAILGFIQLKDITRLQ